MRSANPSYLRDLRQIEIVGHAKRARHGILFRGQSVELRAEVFAIQQVGHADSPPAGFVLIAGADAP